MARTALVVIVKLALVWLASTVTVPPAGTCAVGSLLATLTTRPPVGAALVRVTVRGADWPPVTVDGLTATDCNAGGPLGALKATNSEPPWTALVAHCIEVVKLVCG